MLLAGHDQPVHAALHQLVGLDALLAQPLPVRHPLTRRSASALSLGLALRLWRPLLVHQSDVLAGLQRPQVEEVECQQVGQHVRREVHGAEALRLRVARLVDVDHFAAAAATDALEGAGDDEALAAGLVDEVLSARSHVGL